MSLAFCFVRFILCYQWNSFTLLCFLLMGSFHIGCIILCLSNNSRIILFLLNRLIVCLEGVMLFDCQWNRRLFLHFILGSNFTAYNRSISSLSYVLFIMSIFLLDHFLMWLGRSRFFLIHWDRLLLLFCTFNGDSRDNYLRLVMRLRQEGNGMVGSEFEDMWGWMLLLDGRDLFFWQVCRFVVLKLKNFCVFQAWKVYFLLILVSNTCFFFAFMRNANLLFLLRNDCFYFRLWREDSFYFRLLRRHSFFFWLLRNGNHLQLFCLRWGLIRLSCLNLLIDWCLQSRGLLH